MTEGIKNAFSFFSLGWSLGVVIFFALTIIMFGFWFKREKTIAFILGAYASAIAVNEVYFFNSSYLKSNFIYNNEWIGLIFFFIFLSLTVFTLFRSRIFKHYARSFIPSLAVDISLAALSAMLIFSLCFNYFIPPDALFEVSGLAKFLLSHPILRLLWMVLPIICLFLVRRKNYG